jgi:rubredoxin
MSKDETIQITCPLCGEKGFEKIYVVSNNASRWLRKFLLIPDTPVFLQYLERYRCLSCDYVMMFARDKKKR